MRRGEQPVQGTPGKHAVSLRLGFAGDEFGYAIDLGLPAPSNRPSRTIPRSSASASGTAPCCDRPRCWSIGAARW